MSMSTIYKKKSARKKINSSAAQLELQKVLQRNCELEKQIAELKLLLNNNKTVVIDAGTAKKRRASGSPTGKSKSGLGNPNRFGILHAEQVLDAHESNNEMGDELPEEIEAIVSCETEKTVENSANLKEHTDIIIKTMVQKNLQRKTMTSNPLKVTSKTTAVENEEPENGITRKQAKMPPINVYQQESKDISALLKNVVSKNYLINKNGKRHSITVFCKDDYSAVKAALEKANAPYYTYTPKNEKRQTYLLRGLDNSYTPAEVLEELKSIPTENLNFMNAFRFETSHSKKENRPLSLIAIQISPDSNPSALRDIKYLFNHVVRWEKIKRQGSIQCHNCQRFTHTSANCHMEHRCVKCGGGHDAGKCSLTESSDRAQLYCILCKEHGHPASYAGCKAHVTLKSKLKQRTLLAKSNTKEKEQMLHSYVEKGVSFADYLRGTKSPNITGPAPQISMPKTNALEDIKSAIMGAMKIQFEHLAKTLEVQSKRIDTLFDIIGHLDDNE